MKVFDLPSMRARGKTPCEYCKGPTLISSKGTLCVQYCEESLVETGEEKTRVRQTESRRKR